MSIFNFFKGLKTNNKDSMVLIPAGPFWMGSDNKMEDQKFLDKHQNAWMPRHEVELTEFWIDKYPVTNKQYLMFVKKTGHSEPVTFQRLKEFIAELPAGQQSSLPIQSLRTLTKANHPVVGISWHDAQEFCKWRSKAEGSTYHLPTEAQWEKACRGGMDGAVYPWGNEWHISKCNSAERKKGISFLLRADWATTPVDACPPNGYGLYDMYGNVAQWCLDWFEKNYYKMSPRKNPCGPKEAEERVVRGVSYNFSGQEKYYRLDIRNSESPKKTPLEIGFRCVREAETEDA